MANSEVPSGEREVAWSDHPFGDDPQWGPLRRQVDDIMAAWDQEEWVSGPSRPPVHIDDLVRLKALLIQVEQYLTDHWPEQRLEEHLASLPDPNQPEFSLNEQIARSEYRLVRHWHAQVEFAFWSALPEEERQVLRAQIKEHLASLPHLFETPSEK